MRAGSVWTSLDSGEAILVPIDDYVGRAAFFVGDLDRKVSGVIRRVVRPGDKVLDIGANLGIVTLPLSRLVRETGVVHSFEPNPVVRNLLEQSLARNGARNVRVHDCALSSEGGEMILSYPADNAGRGTLAGPESRPDWGAVRVPVRTLSSLAAEVDLTGVRLMRIDVEGHEFDALRGGLDWLRTHPPDVVLFESNTDAADESRSVHSLLVGAGYRLFSLPKSLSSLRLIPYPVGASRGPSHDMVAIAPHCEQEVLARF